MVHYINVLVKICLFLYLILLTSAVNLLDYEMTDKLVEIDKNDWVELRDLYRTAWPERNIISYYILDNFIGWVKQEPNFKHLHVYSLNGDWSDGTFIVIHRNKMFIDTLSSSTERMFKLLQLVDYRHGISFSMISSDSLREVVLRTVDNESLNINKTARWLSFYMPREVATNLDFHIPDDVTLRPLDDSDCEVVNNALTYKSNGTLQLLKIQRRLNPSVGMFTTEGKLIAWSFQTQTGSIGALYVHPDYRRQGYGSLVVKALSKIIGERGDHVLAFVEELNMPARKLFEKCGFTIVGTIHRIVTSPIFPFEWIDVFD
ncbi:uncharacterized protein LOC119071268 [Bradysia coprophila]|uniref:uncharacterized protein LOC119071268 n=1 Tax=Bradysia coprophila TaxID=38358 RepID=UPI00187D7A5C|nr:uncharacterized protein LOC119071268 [Bradysia coprophila]